MYSWNDADTVFILLSWLSIPPVLQLGNMKSEKVTWRRSHYERIDTIFLLSWGTTSSSTETAIPTSGF